MSTQTDFPTGSQKPIAREFGYINLGGAEFPDQSGHSGEVLTTDGTTVYWTPATGTGTVTSVDFTGPTGFTVSGNPIVGAGILVLTANSQAAAKFYGSPASTTGVPDFRVLAATDIPFLAASKINSGTFNTAQLGSGTADNTKFLRGDNTWQTVPQGSVTSVDMTVPSIFSIGGNPITSSGILALTLNNQAQNVILAGPASGSGAVTFRTLAPSDIPSLAFSKITGTVPLNQGGTGQTTQAPAFNALAPSQASNSGKYLTTDGTNATWGSIVLTSGTVTSIGISVPNILTVSNTPITSSGVIAIDLASANPNVFLGGPDATSGTPTFRGIIPADVPSLDAAKITSGIFGTARLGTGTADTTKFLRGDGSWQVNPLGTVTSVTLTVPSALFATTGSPITGSGILDFTINNQSANTVWSGPASGSSATPTFRALVPADIPGLDAAKIITGTFTSSQIPGLDTSKITSGVFAAGFLPIIAVNKGGTGQTTANDAFNVLAPSQTSANGLFLKSNGTDTSWSAITIGGSNTQVQYNNAGVPGGITGVTSDGTKFTALAAVGSISLNASGSSSTNINTGSSTGATNIGNSSNTGGVSIVTQGTVDRTLYTPTISSFSYLGKNYLKKSSGTVSSGFGVADAYYADTDTGTDRIMGGTIWEWSDATDATRSSKLSLLITKNAVPAPRFTFNQDGEFGIAGSSSGILSVKAAAATSTHTLTMPDTQGGANTYLKNDGSGGLTWATVSGGSGTVTTVSVTTANGVSGSVANATTTPAISLTLGAITPTTVNKITLTQPASGATLTLTDGKTLAATNTLTLSGTDSTVMTFPATSASVARIDAAQTFTGVQTFSSTIVGSINGNAATVTNATLTTALTVNTGTVQLKGNAANTSALTIGAGAVSVSGTNTGDQTTVSGNAGTATALQTARTIGGISFDGTANTTVATATGGFTVSGGDLALTTNNITLTGSIGATGARVTKVWATDMQVTNAITGSVTGNAATATALQNAVTIGGTSFDGTGNITVTTATGGFTISGGNLVLGTNSLTLTGSIASTGSRVTKGWFTNLEITNAPTVGGANVYYTGGTDVAVADGGTGKSSWTQWLIPYADTTTSFAQIAIGSSGQVLTSNGAGAAPTFQAAGGGGSREIWQVQMLKGTTGAAITSQNSNLLNKTTNNLIGLADQTSVIRYDGTTITVTSHGASANASMALCARAGGTVAIQTGGSGTWRYSTDDGATWNNATGGTTGIAGGYFAVGAVTGSGGSTTTWMFLSITTGVVGYRSTDDAHTWNTVLAVFGVTTTVAAGVATDSAGNWVALGTSGLVRTSTDDGATFGAGSMGSLTTSGRILTFANSLFIAADAVQGGLIYYSTGVGVAWTTLRSPTNSQILGISYWNSLYFVIDSGNTVYSCPDITVTNPLWTKVASLIPNANSSTELVYYGSKYYVIDNVGSSNTGGLLYQLNP